MDPEAPRTNLSSSSRLPWVAALVVVAALVGGGAWWFLRTPEPAPPPPVAAAEPEPTAADTAATADAVAPQSPPLDAESARVALEGASTSPLFRSWLVGDLVRRWVTVTANLAENESPRTALKALAPAGRFSTVPRGDRLAIAPESYARYDAFADAIGSIDAGTVASVYRRLHPVLEGAWRAAGMSARPLDAATARALRRIAGVRVVDGDVIVVPGDNGYVFADPSLEALGEIDKHLLRMGPRNERILKAKARAILEALALPVVATHRP